MIRQQNTINFRETQKLANTLITNSIKVKKSNSYELRNEIIMSIILNLLANDLFLKIISDKTAIRTTITSKTQKFTVFFKPNKVIKSKSYELKRLIQLI